MHSHKYTCTLKRDQRHNYEANSDFALLLSAPKKIAAFLLCTEQRIRGKDATHLHAKRLPAGFRKVSEHKSKGSQRHNSQWVEMSNIGLTTKALVLRHIA